MKRLKFFLACCIVCAASVTGAQSAPPLTAPAQAETQSTAEQPMEHKAGSATIPPKVVHAVVPKYSGKARHDKLSGISLISLTVGVDGMPRDVKVSRSMADARPAKDHAAAVTLDENAVKAVRKYRFEPATLNGKPVPVAINIEVNYQLF